MPTTVCLAGNSLHYPEQLWPYLNWALSLRAVGCQVVWLEALEEDPSPEWIDPAVAALRARLAPYGFDAPLSLVASDGRPVVPTPDGAVPFEAALDADVLIDLGYLPPDLVRRFRRSIFVDLDPGAAQIWIEAGDIDVSGHDLHISIGEGVEARDRRFPDGGVRWRYFPTPIALDVWTPTGTAPRGGAYTTISHWWDRDHLEIGGQWVDNSKRAGFEPFLTLPSLTAARLELALGGLEDEDERERLQNLGWSVRDAAHVASTPESYHDYVQSSRGELTAAKQPYVLLASGWLNDRTASYLAAGKPAIVQRTIEQRDSRLPDDEGLLRFATVEEAAGALARVEADYERHARRAREIAEEHFDGAKIARRVVELALDQG